MPVEISMGKKAKHEPVDPARDVYQVIMRAPNPLALVKMIREMGLDVDHGHRPPKGERVEVQGFLTQAQIDALKQEGWHVKVERNLSAVGRERQKEVGTGDRFKGGKIAPKGLGKKTGGPKK